MIELFHQSMKVNKLLTASDYANNVEDIKNGIKGEH